MDSAPTETAPDRLAIKTPLPSAVDRPDLRAAPHCVEVGADDDLERDPMTVHFVGAARDPTDPVTVVR
jgi:hypothetical protein